MANRFVEARVLPFSRCSLPYPSALQSGMSSLIREQVHERTVAGRHIERERVRFELGACDLIQWDRKVPHLRSAKEAIYTSTLGSSSIEQHGKPSR
jgi:hypothetical protein